MKVTTPRRLGVLECEEFMSQRPLFSLRYEVLWISYGFYSLHKSFGFTLSNRFLNMKKNIM